MRFPGPGLILPLLIAFTAPVQAGLDSYTLFSPVRSNQTYLLDRDGEKVHEWSHEHKTVTSVYLLPDGDLLRTAAGDVIEFQGNGIGGRVERVDWRGDVEWSYSYVSEQAQLHHDVEPMPNGNVLMIAWRRISAEEAIAAGRDPDTLFSEELWPDAIIEVKPTGPDSGEIVWEWRSWDHLVQDFDPGKANFGVVADHPELIDLNYLGLSNGVADWHHANAVDYNPELDQIMLSVLAFCEVWIIDHSTTTEEAAGHSGGRSGRGGDLLFRWGNPAAYRAGDEEDKRLYAQHDSEWIPPGYPGAGNILVFNNGRDRPQGDWSTVEEIITAPRADGSYARDTGGRFLPAESTLVYEAAVPVEFFATNMSGAQRLRNGNTLITNGPAAEYFEVTPAGEIGRHQRKLVRPVA
jgi:hypothetical protein